MSTPRDARASSRDQRRHLQIVANRLERIRSRSPSPSPSAPPKSPSPPKRSTQEVEDEQFQAAMAYAMPGLSVDDIVKIATASAQAAAREFAMANPPTAAAPPTPSASQTIRKVELPQFDKNNIHTWIRRVEAAFGRAGVTGAKDKFFFIEAKLDVNLNPKINEYLCGESTDASWDAFLQVSTRRVWPDKGTAGCPFSQWHSQRRTATHPAFGKN